MEKKAENTNLNVEDATVRHVGVRTESLVGFPYMSSCASIKRCNLLTFDTAVGRASRERPCTVRVRHDDTILRYQYKLNWPRQLDATEDDLREAQELATAMTLVSMTQVCIR